MPLHNAIILAWVGAIVTGPTPDHSRHHLEATGPTMIALGSRAHLYARPEVRKALRSFFADVLGCLPETISGSTMLLCRLAERTSVSVEFTADALDDEHAARGAWLEVRTSDPDALRERVLAAGLPQVKHPGSDRFYFRAPGGQVWGIIALRRS